ITSYLIYFSSLLVPDVGRQSLYRAMVLLISNKVLSSRRHLLPSAAPLRTVRATFTAYGSSLH
ncbi:hypothetical protein AB4586_24825, partial [Vibrio sp. 10N.222.49.E4]